MPWHVSRSSECPAGEPFAVIKDSDGSVVGCHATEADAQDQVAALYASERASGGTGMEDVERRFTPGAVELRATPQGDRPARIGGYAAVFNRLSKNLGGFVEQVAPAAFNRHGGQGFEGAIARFHHDDMALLGTIAARTLTMRTDGTGLDYEVEPPKARADVVELVERGDVRWSSFAFRTIGADGDEWGLSDQGYPMRTVTSALVVDVAPTFSPAYADATAGLRSLAQKFDADLVEVRSLAQADQLTKFFKRTDRKGREGKTLDPVAARVELMERSTPDWAA